jgi:uncharacterized membrane protein
MNRQTLNLMIASSIASALAAASPGLAAGERENCYGVALKGHARRRRTAARAKPRSATMVNRGNPCRKEPVSASRVPLVPVR